MKTILASVDATPSNALSNPLNVRRPIPWYTVGSERILSNNQDRAHVMKIITSKSSTHAPQAELLLIINVKSRNRNRL